MSDSEDTVSVCTSLADYSPVASDNEGTYSTVESVKLRPMRAIHRQRSVSREKGARALINAASFQVSLKFEVASNFAYAVSIHNPVKRLITRIYL
jgi:hypothetical protein